jgi:NADPH-dependent 2,4-dienoyl-CoA reductase/sulfur reductase-like enzyme
MRYLVIGNGVAGITAAFTIRAREPKAEITVVSGESDYYYSRTALMYAFMDRMSLRDLEPYERKVYDRQAIRRIYDWVVDLDAGTHAVTVRSGQKIHYDRMLIATGSVPRRPGWKGLNEAKDGVCHFVSLQDLAKCEELTRASREAVVVGGGLIGVELAECIVHQGRKLTFLVREPWYWPAALGGEEGSMISDHIRRHGVNLLLNEEVAEVLRDAAGRVRGVNTTSGNEFACQMLGIAIGVRPCVNWLEGVKTRPDIRDGIVVRGNFLTSLPDVYAAGDCAETPVGCEQIWYSAKRQGELAGRSMLGDRIDYKPPVFYNSAKFFEVEYTTVGEVNNVPSDAISFYRRIPGREASVRIVEHAGAVIGFNMLGSRWDHTVLERWILERRSLEYVLGVLHQAQFDVEFGRLNLRALAASGVH